MGSIYTHMLPKALAAGAPPQTLNSKGERQSAFGVCQSDTKKLKMVLTLQKLLPFTPNCSPVPKALVAAWGSAPYPQ